MTPAVAVVISLARRADRLAAFRDRWEQVGLGVPLLVLTATDQATHPPPDAGWNRYPPGAWGCWDSHIRALRLTCGPVLVLEDDAVFAPRFGVVLTQLTLPATWDVVHLGGQHVVTPTPVVPGLVRPRCVLRTHAYLAHHPRALATQLAAKPTHVDYAFGSLGLTRYATDPWIAGQDDSPGDITRTRPDRVEFWQEAR